MGHVDLNQISFTLPDGRPLLDEVSFRVGDGAVVALIGPNGTGKTTLLRIIAGDLDPHGGISPDTLPPQVRDKLNLHYAVGVLLQWAA